MKKIFLLILAIQLPVLVYAANWVEISTKTYVDLSTIGKSSTFVSAWIKQLNDGTFSNIENKKVHYYLDNYVANCSERTLAIPVGNTYGLDGKTIISYDHSARDYRVWKWKSIVPDSRGEFIYETLCGYYF